MGRIRSCLVFVFAAWSVMLPAQSPIPGSKQSGPILILNATAHLGNGQVIENSAIAFENGKFTTVADAKTIKLDMSYFDTIIRAEGKHLYPGLIALNSSLGLVEIEAVRASVDDRETGTLLPNVRSLPAYNTDSRVIPTVRSNGVLLAQIAPRGGLISGSSSVVQFDAWNWEDAVIDTDDGIYMTWPPMYRHTGWWAEPGGVEPDEKAEESIATLREFFLRARAYQQSTPVERDLKMEGMRGIYKGSTRLYIRVSYAKDILRVLDFIKEMQIPKAALVGATDAWMVTDQIKAAGVDVVLNRVHELPVRPEDDILQPYQTPALLQKAGIRFCITSEGDMEPMNTRNLAFNAGTAAAYGLSEEEAISAITLSPAQIAGIDDRYGSIQIGKSATFILSTGNILDMRTSNVENAFIDGRMLVMDDYQKALKRKFEKNQ